MAEIGPKTFTGECHFSPTGWALWEYYECAPGRISTRCTCQEVPAPAIHEETPDV